MQNILKKKGYNVGTVRDILFLPIENIADIPELVDNELDTSAIVLAGIEGWYYMYFVIDTGEFSEDETIKDGAIIYKQKLEADVAKENLNRWVNFEQMEYRQFMMIIRDNNNVSRFAGAINLQGEKSGMELKKKYSTNKTRPNRNGYTLTFTRETTDRAPLAFNLQDLLLIVEPPWDPGDGGEPIIPPQP